MFQDGNLKPFIKSQPIPETNIEPVKVVVAESLHDMVFNSGKNGLSLLVFSLVASFKVYSYSCLFKTAQLEIFRNFFQKELLNGFSKI